MIDCLAIGETMALLTAPASQPLRMASTATLSFGGAESNVAVGLARLGLNAAWCGCLGRDELGFMIRNRLRGEGVDTSAVQWTDEQPTSLMIKAQRPQGWTEVTYYRTGLAGSRVRATSEVIDLVRESRLVHLTGITPALGGAARQCFEQVLVEARDAGVPVSLDVNFRPSLWPADEARRYLRQWLPLVEILFAGRAELAMMCGAESELSDVSTTNSLHHAQLVQATGPTVVIAKLGIHGAALVQRDGTTATPGQPVAKPVDPVGAGDGFVAGFLSAWLEDSPAEECLIRGCLVGSFVVASSGDWEGLPLRHEVERVMPAPGSVIR